MQPPKIEWLQRAEQAVQADLVGSQVEETTGPMSAIDLAILFEEQEDMLRARSRLAHELGKVLQANRINGIERRLDELSERLAR